MSDITKQAEQIKWFLMELAAQEKADIESDEFDIYGEDKEGHEGCFSVSITDLAGKSLKTIEELQAKLVSAEKVVAAAELILKFHN